MSTIITGDASEVSNSLSASVDDATNASPIVIETSAPHLFATNDTVVIDGVEGNTAANGTWTITKLTSTTFSLDGSTGSGAYTTGGTATDRSLTPQFTIPDDGDDLDAASINVALEALADRTQNLNLLATRFQYELGQDSSITLTAQPGGRVVELTDAVVSLSNRVYTLSSEGAMIGDWIRIFARRPTLIADYFSIYVEVRNEAAQTLAFVGFGHTRSDTTSALFIFTDDGWVLASSDAPRPLQRLVTFQPTMRSSAAQGAAVYSGIGNLVADAHLSLLHFGIQFASANQGDNKGFLYSQQIPPGALLDGATLTEVRIRQVAVTTHSSLPEVMPHIWVVRFNRTIDTIDDLLSTGASVDTSASTAAYDAAHDVIFTPDQNNNIDTGSYTYFLVYQQEGGASSQTDGRVYNARLTFTWP